MWNAIKLLFRKNFIALNDCSRKEENEMGGGGKERERSAD